MRDPKTALFNLSARQLQALAVLGECRNIHRAAAALNLSQPAVSKMLSQMERRMQTRLFSRSVRGVEPTPAGAVLISRARTIRAEMARAGEDLHTLSLGRPETFRIGTLQSAAAMLVPRAVLRLRTEMTGLSVSIGEGNFDALIDQLTAAKIDVLVGRLGFRPRAGEFEERFLTDENLRIVVRPGHPLAQKRRLAWADLHPYEWILPAPSTGLRSRMDMLLAEMRAPVPERLIESGSLLCSVAMLLESDALMPLPGGLAKHYKAIGQAAFLAIDLPAMFGPLGVVWRRTSSASPVRNRFVALLLEEAASRS